MVWGAIASAAGNIIGGVLSDRSQRDTAQQQIAAQQEISERNIKLQEDFAQQGIRWRVRDALEAGIHPLFALGAQIPSASPTAFVPGELPDGALGRGIAQAGQDIGRAIDSTRTSEERVGARLSALSLERAELENDLLRSQIARINQQQTPPTPDLRPGGLIPGQGDASNLITEKPMERTPASPGMPHSEPGSIPGVGWMEIPGGGLRAVPGETVKQRIEDTFIPEALWALENNILPNFTSGDALAPPRSLLPEGALGWKFNRWKQAWVPFYERDATGSRVYRYTLPSD